MKHLLQHLALALALAPMSGSVSKLACAADNDAPKGSVKEPALKEASPRAKKAQPAKLGNAKRVEMFDAMEKGLISVDYIGKDSKEAN
ncbi:MAG: hypothetical protein KGS49_16180, partial [Planctomycetes bacterium]|nr:hypothetical protein [Planctomycetota bacterium]